MGVDREVAVLPRSQLLAMSVYWLGASAIWGGYEIFGQQRVEYFVGKATRGEVIGYIEFTAALVAILVQPTIGTISDYTATRWGRRKPYILIGALLDVVFIFGVATSQSLVAMFAFLLLLMLSANFAQGPFQGYVPDLVPERQVDVASALVGFMRLAGLVGGGVIVASGAATGNYAVPFIAIGIFELVLALVTVVFVREGPVARPREGRSWLSIAGEAWGLDALRERGFVFMSLTRLFFLAGPSVFVNLSFYFMQDSLRLTGSDLQFWLTVGTLTIGIGTLVGTLTSAWVANRVGRKRVAWISGAISALGILLIVRAPAPIDMFPGLLALGLGSGGYIAIDWALMTSTIPRISSGRYMGLANIANSVAGPIGLIIGGRILDYVTRTVGIDAGPRAAVLVGLPFLIAGALMLIPVKARVEPPGEVQLEAAAVEG